MFEVSEAVVQRSSCPEVFYAKGVLKHFAKFAGKSLCQSLFFNKVVDLRPATLLKKRLWRRCFPVDFATFLWTPSLQNSSGCFLIFLFLKFISHHTKEILYVNTNLRETSHELKANIFSLFLILMLKKTVF